jgi:hypothetical protein
MVSTWVDVMADQLAVLMAVQMVGLREYEWAEKWVRIGDMG